jgi:hypothetical protein
MPTAEQQQAHREAIAARVARLVEEHIKAQCEVLKEDLRLVAQAGGNLFELRSSFSVFSTDSVDMVDKLGLLTQAMHQTIQEIQKPDWLNVHPGSSHLRRFNNLVWTREPYQYFTLSVSACEEILNTTVDKIFQCDKMRWLSETKGLAKGLVFESGVGDEAVFRDKVSAQKLSPELSEDYQLGNLIFGETDHKQLRSHDREPVDPRRQEVPTRMVPTSLVPFLAEKFTKAGFSVELCVHRMEWGVLCGRKGYDILSNLRISWPC